MGEELPLFFLPAPSLRRELFFHVVLLHLERARRRLLRDFSPHFGLLSDTPSLQRALVAVCYFSATSSVFVFIFSFFFFPFILIIVIFFVVLLHAEESFLKSKKSPLTKYISRIWRNVCYVWKIYIYIWEFFFNVTNVFLNLRNVFLGEVSLVLRLFL